jgi:hypothetical protein
MASEAQSLIFELSYTTPAWATGVSGHHRLVSYDGHQGLRLNPPSGTAAGPDCMLIIKAARSIK